MEAQNGQAHPVPLTGLGPFDVIVADPPWVNDTVHWRARDESHGNYPRMGKKELRALPVPHITADRALLFLWVIAGEIDQALKLIKAWGFEYATVMFVWTKVQRDGVSPKPTRSSPYYSLKSTEFCLVARKGFRPDAQAAVHDVIREFPREHSRKPEEFWRRLEQYLGTTYPRRLELFAREARPGWAAWGNQVGHFSTGSQSSGSSQRAIAMEE